MSVITSIKQQKNKNRVNVYLDGEFSFGIDLDNFVLLNIKIGQELSEKEIKEIIKKAEFQKAFDKLLKWAMGRPHSEKEILDYFQRRKVPNMIHKDLFSRLKYFGFLDDEKFTRFWVDSRKVFNSKPKRVLKQELKLKGVDEEIISRVLDESKIDEFFIANNLLTKRKLHWERIERKKRRQKMFAYLAGKGFSFEVAKKAIERYNNYEDEQVKD